MVGMTGQASGLVFGQVAGNKLMRSVAQAGKQATSREDCRWGLPCEGCGIPPAAACWGLGLWLKTWLRTRYPPHGKLACLSQA